MAEARDPFDLCGVTIDGKYRVASVIGDGGFGVVYRGVHKGFGELIAIKCLKLPSDLDEKARADFLERLQDEGRLLHRLSKATSGIVQALDVGAFTTPAGTWVPYLILEWLEGETLAQRLKTRIDLDEGGMSIAEAIGLLAPAARALAVAHAQKIAHRDVKPANIFLTEVGGKQTTKVLDFGIAKVLADHNTFTTALEATGLAPAAFTPRYGAPEQFNKQRGASGPWTDVFALALVLVECASGKRALEGDDPTQLYIASADPALRPTLRRRGVEEASDEVERVLRKALEVEPRDRYPDAATFWDALEEAAGLERSEPRGTRVSRPSGTTEREPMADESFLDTSEFAAKRAIKVDGVSAKTSMGPTVPVESLRQVPAAVEKRRGRSASSSSSGLRSSSSGDDPMAETPEGERIAHRASVSSTKPSGPDSSGSSSRWSAIWTVLALLVFAAGAAFAAITFFGGQKTKDPAPSTKPSASTAKIEPHPTATHAPRASSAPSASAIVSSVPSADSADAKDPTAPPPEGMVRIAAASFKMGEAGVETKVSKDFFIDKTEVTWRAYKACFEARKCPAADRVIGVAGADPEAYSAEWSPKCNAKRGALDGPMNCVDAKAAEQFCAFVEHRLPTEAEWELAARGTGGRVHSFGAGDPNCTTACYSRDNLCQKSGADVTTCTVAKFKDDKTPEGVFDLAGNVAEWTADGFGDLPGGNDPHVAPGDQRVVRGGNFLDDEELLIATVRRSFAPTGAHVEIGFRCAADAK